MSTYSDDRPRRYRSQRDGRSREYVEEERYVTRGGVDPRDSRRMDLVPRRRDDSVSSVEEIERDFAPGDGGYVKRRTTVREGIRPVRRARSVDRYDDGYYEDSRRSEYTSKRSGRRDYDRRDRRSRKYESDSDSVSRSPPRRRDSMTEKALAALGLSGAAGALAAHRSKSRHRSRSRSDSRSRRSRAGSRAPSRGRRSKSAYTSRSRSRSKGGDRNAKIAQALKAALAAGAAEAVRARKEPGGITGEKGKRILTAAISAAGVDGLIDRDPEKHSKRHILESALAGLATTHFVNGPRSKSRGRDGSRERSQSRGGVKDLAAGGILAAAGKSIYDRVRSKSRGRARSTSADSYSSYDSRGPSRRRDKPRSRSKSLVDTARKGMAALGIGKAVDDRRKSRKDDYSSDEDYSRDVRAPRSMAATPGPNQMMTSPSSAQFLHEPHHLGDPNTDSDSDLGSSTDEERKHKKSRNRQLLTAGLATVATIHAAHSLHSSMVAREERRHALKEGEISKSEAKKEKNKARLQDAASIGIAALGIKGAFSEWKEVKEKREEAKEEREKIERHRAKRAARRAKLEMMQQQQQQQGYLPAPYNPAYSTSAPNLYSPTMSGAVHPNPYIPPQYAGGNNGVGPYYRDDNPYSSGSFSPGPPAPTPPGQPPNR